MLYICFNFMIFNNTWNFNKYLLWLFYCILGKKSGKQEYGYQTGRNHV